MCQSRPSGLVRLQQSSWALARPACRWPERPKTREPHPLVNRSKWHVTRSYTQDKALYKIVPGSGIKYVHKPPAKVHLYICFNITSHTNLTVGGPLVTTSQVVTNLYSQVCLDYRQLRQASLSFFQEIQLFTTQYTLLQQPDVKLMPTDFLCILRLIIVTKALINSEI